MLTILVGPIARLFGRNLVLSTHGIIYKILMKIIFFFYQFLPSKDTTSEMFFIIFFNCLCEYAVRSNNYLFCFIISEKWVFKHVYWDINSFLPAPFELCEKNISFCNVLLIWGKHSLYILTLKALVQLRVTNRPCSNLTVSMNQTFCSCARIVH